MDKERLSYGKAVNRRRILAEHRRGIHDISRRIIERIEAKDRLAELGKLLSPDNGTLSRMNAYDREQTRAELEIEQIWLQLKCGLITQEQRNQLLSSKFDELEKAKPDVYHELVKNDHGLSIAQQIRNRVIPPIHVGGYYTKR
ncbi:hypothetical protein KKG44_04890 [Patescibacteria group bacterium]|nr:hypothetical protein [Patescibacteria group bacterium]MBU2460419.1 hypothetical protein [Patescibacteria group bacterium]MBU2544512.1 hypothetical protein [Patescibacteria group bacterium]